MYLDQVNYELNKKINEFVCNSNDAPTPEERIDILKLIMSYVTHLSLWKTKNIGNFITNVKKN